MILHLCRIPQGGAAATPCPRLERIRAGDESIEHRVRVPSSHCTGTPSTQPSAAAAAETVLRCIAVLWGAAVGSCACRRQQGCAEDRRGPRQGGTAAATALPGAHAPGRVAARCRAGHRVWQGGGRHGAGDSLSLWGKVCGRPRVAQERLCGGDAAVVAPPRWGTGG